MILYYAMGGGLGHVTRARAALHTLRPGEPALVVCAPGIACSPDVTEGLRTVAPEAGLAARPSAYRAWLARLLGSVRPSELYVDAFPGGILGEWCGFPFPPGLRRYHLARRLRWPAYGPRLSGPLPTYEKSYRLEPLDAAHEQALRACSAQLRDLALRYPPARREIGPEGPGGEGPFWIVVHAGPDEEVRELLDYARETMVAEGRGRPIRLVTPRPPARLPRGAIWRPCYPAAPLMRAAERIVTACGFNVMQETLAHRPRHRFLPFPRPLDDQHARARAHRARA